MMQLVFEGGIALLVTYTCVMNTISFFQLRHWEQEVRHSQRKAREDSTA
jgi:hypothetical protein